MSQLEDFIKNNQDAFEEDMPVGHFKRFEDKLSGRQKKTVQLIR